MTAKAAVIRYTSTGNKVVSPPKFSPAAYLAWARVPLAVAALVVTKMYMADAGVAFYILLAVYLVYSAAVAFRPRVQTGLVGMLGLFGDTVYWLIISGYGTDQMLWVSSLYFLFLLTAALVLHGAVETVLITVIAVVFCAVLPNPVLERLERTVLVAGALASGFAVATRRSRSREASVEQELQEARGAAEMASEQERQRIAADFHDGPLQSFISMQMRLAILRKIFERDHDAGMRDLQELQALAQSQISDLRTFLHAMRPVDVDGANLISTARRTAETFQKESGIPVTFIGTTLPVGLPQETTLEVLQMIREALHNVQKHAHATRVAVAVEKHDRALEIAIDDNGNGFSFAGTYNLEELELLRLGPASLKRRARSINADLQLESRPGRGAGLKVRVPLQ
ncbi:MAG TPA: sensor histidine kinase [Candidatus Limnocylindrales bacterium]|nr:sensor histidine kinase [Candidatus Limnocylindrales bacterium]